MTRTTSNVKPIDFDEIRRRFSNRTEVPLSSAELCKMQQGQISASNLRPIDPADRRIFDGPVDMIELYRAGLKRPTLGENLVAFMRMNGETLSFWFALASVGFALAVVGGAFLGWQR